MIAPLAFFDKAVIFFYKRNYTNKQLKHYTQHHNILFLCKALTKSIMSKTQPELAKDVIQIYPPWKLNN